MGGDALGQGAIERRPVALAVLGERPADLSETVDLGGVPRRRQMLWSEARGTGGALGGATAVVALTWDHGIGATGGGM